MKTRRSSASKVASVSRYCFIYKARDDNWYMDLADREYGEERDAFTYGPFPTQDAVDDYLRRNHSNPGGAQIDDSGRKPVPRRSPNGSPVEKPRKKRDWWASGYKTRRASATLGREITAGLDYDDIR